MLSTARKSDRDVAGASLLGDLDRHLLAEGRHWRAYERLGAHAVAIDGTGAVAFAVWAPNARAVSVVGSFNDWNGDAHLMRRRSDCGVWELIVPDIRHGTPYQYEIHTAHGEVRRKGDPYAFWSEMAPATASRVWAAPPFAWSDAEWMAARAAHGSPSTAMSIYEVHAGSWRRHADGRAYTYAELADVLIPYVRELGFTHIELLPAAEHPFGGSWGYQPTALFAPSARGGTPDDLRAFVDRCHGMGIGVLLDWVPGHFPDDPHGLERFDGTCLYEHADPRRNRQPEWGTLVYNLDRREVANFLIANAIYWLHEFHLDGLRVDAVAAMLYLDYGRGGGDWVANADGGRENHAAIAFLQRLNEVLREQAPAGAITIAEESTAWPGVTRPVQRGGLGFDYKWNLGWMNDTLRYMRRDPVHRRHHQDELTFGPLYAHSERFVLPLSHDEVVHGKDSLLAKMPGDRWQRFANLRLYLAFQYSQPGKKLLFMGGEFGQTGEWNHDRELDWAALADRLHAGVRRALGDLNLLYRTVPALHEGDCTDDGFRWIDCRDTEQSVLCYRRIGTDAREFAIVVCNFTPVVRSGYRVGVPRDGAYREIFNSDALDYGGSGRGNLGQVIADPVPWHGEAQSLALELPPLAALFLLPP